MTFKELLVKHEGLRLKPYRCTAGKLTIGVGRNLEDRGISNDEAMLLLDNDIEQTLRECRTFPWFEQLDNVRQAVVASMVFNLGLSKFQKFKKTIAALEAGDYAEAAREMVLSDWFTQVGKRGPELMEMMRTGRG
ncbi:MAG: lysozyme [Deltaproteobacteria bacterium]|nr:lysozyme [Deltaproteobacteria bacterium]MCL4873106.1 lysozyme [bacterium]